MYPTFETRRRRVGIAVALVLAIGLLAIAATARAFVSPPTEPLTLDAAKRAIVHHEQKTGEWRVDALRGCHRRWYGEIVCKVDETETWKTCFPVGCAYLTQTIKVGAQRRHGRIVVRWHLPEFGR